jgi:O-antigen/teichoic acid export membrane protein
MLFKRLVKPYLNNSLWFFLEHITKGIGSIFVFGLIARHLTTYDFGALNFGLAIISLITPLVRLGLESTLVVHLTRVQDKAYVIKNTFWMISLSSVFALILLNATLSVLDITNQIKNVISLLSIGLLGLAFHTLDSLYQSLILTKLSSISKISALIIGVGLKIYLLSTNSSLELIAFSFALDYFFIAVLLIFFLNKTDLSLKLILSKSIDSKIIKVLFKSAWPMIISGVSGVVLIKTDQLFVNHYLGIHSLGLYSAGSKVYEGWISFMYVYSIAALPLIISFQKLVEVSRVRQFSYLFAIPLWLCIFFALIITFYGDFVLGLIFGSKYLEAYHSLVILAWASVFSSFGYLSSRYLIVANLQNVIARRNVIAIFINIILNIVLIGPYGLIGAALSTLISLFFVHFILDFFDNNLYELRSIKLKSFIFFIR